jgi:hypothetical protein
MIDEVYYDDRDSILERTRGALRRERARLLRTPQGHVLSHVMPAARACGALAQLGTAMIVSIDGRRLAAAASWRGELAAAAAAPRRGRPSASFARSFLLRTGITTRPQSVRSPPFPAAQL